MVFNFVNPGQLPFYVEMNKEEFEENKKEGLIKKGKFHSDQFGDFPIIIAFKSVHRTWSTVKEDKDPEQNRTQYRPLADSIEDLHALRVTTIP